MDEMDEMKWMEKRKQMEKMKQMKAHEKNNRTARHSSSPARPLSSSSAGTSLSSSAKDFISRNILLIWPIPIFVLLLLINISSADTKLFGWSIPTFFDRFLSAPVASGVPLPPDMSWFTLCIIVLLLNAMCGALGVILGGLLGPKVTAWGKRSLYDTAKSAFIVLFIFAGFQLTTASWGSSTCKGAVCIGFLQLERAISFAETIRGTITMEFGTLTAATAVLSSFLNITPYFRPAGIIGISFSFSPAFRPLFDALGILLSLLSVSVGEWYVHGWLLAFIKSRMLGLLLPIGIFLRAWAFPRAGDALIAIAIGFFFMYPFMLNVSSYAIENYLMSEFGTVQTQGSDGSSFRTFGECVDASRASGSSFICFFKLGSIGAWHYIKQIATGFNPVGGILIFGFVQLITGALPNAIIVAFVALYILALLKVSAFYVLVVSIIIPLFILFVVLTTIKEIAGFLGTQMDFSTFEKLL